MDDLEARLLRCFAVILPDLPEEELRQATMSSVSAWDSMVTVTLINVVEEEFGVQIGLEDVEHLVSFDDFRNYLRNKDVRV